MPDAEASVKRAAAMAILGEVAADLAYGELYTLLAGGDLFVSDRRRALARLSGFADQERALLGLLALDLAVPASLCSGPLAELALSLVAAGMASIEGGQVRAGDLVLVPVLNGLLLTATPPRWRPDQGRTGTNLSNEGQAGADRPRAYLGEDSLRLARALPDTTGKSVLDVGTGCGLQGLLSMAGARAATLSDVEARSLELAECNRLLNRIGDHVRVVEGPGFSPVAGERFDLIAALPPYLPSIGTLADPAVSGGPDGLSLVRELVAGAEAHLSPGGELVVAAQLLCDDDGPLLARELAGLAPTCTSRILASDWHPIGPYAAELASRLAGAHQSPAASLLADYRSSFAAQGVTGACTAFVRLRPTAGGVQGGSSASALGRRTPEDVFAAQAGLRYAMDKSLRSVVGPGAAPVVLRGPTAALLAAFEGGRDVRSAVAAAWGTPEGADPAVLLDEALERVGELEGLGLLEERR